MTRIHRNQVMTSHIEAIEEPNSKVRQVRKCDFSKDEKNVQLLTYES